MKTNAMLAAISVMACLFAAPVLAQEIEIETDEIVQVEREVIMIDRDGAVAADDRDVRVIRLRSGDRDGSLDRQIDDMEKVEVRIVKMGESADLSEAEIKAITEERIAEGDMVVFSGKEMRCERRSGGEVRLQLCTDEGRRSALSALRKARASLASQTRVNFESRSRAVDALDRRIADLEAEIGQ